ncbi:unnamed protein product, partial [Gulo gulo]
MSSTILFSGTSSGCHPALTQGRGDGAARSPERKGAGGLGSTLAWMGSCSPHPKGRVLGMGQGRVSGSGFLEGSSVSLVTEPLNAASAGLGFLSAEWDEAPFTGAPTSGHERSTRPGRQ